MDNEKDLSAGARLKKLRLDKKLTLEQVHKKTKIHLKILEDLEQDRLIHLDPVYLRGLLKLYCGLLGVDAQEYFQQYQKLASSQEPTEKDQALLPGLKVKVSKFDRYSAKLRKIILVILFFIIGLFILFRLAKITKGPSLPQEDKKSTGVEVAKAVAPTTSIIKVTVRAKQDCWIKATVDGRAVFQTILKKGRFETWKAKDHIELSLGNAGGIELEVNGKLFSPLGRRGQVVRRILINKEGLRVIR